MTPRLYVLDLECPRCLKPSTTVVRRIKPLPILTCDDCAYTKLRITGCEVQSDVVGEVFERHRQGWVYSLTERSTKQ